MFVCESEVLFSATGQTNVNRLIKYGKVLCEFTLSIVSGINFETLKHNPTCCDPVYNYQSMTSILPVYCQYTNILKLIIKSLSRWLSKNLLSVRIFEEYNEQSIMRGLQYNHQELYIHCNLGPGV